MLGSELGVGRYGSRCLGLDGTLCNSLEEEKPWMCLRSCARALTCSGEQSCSQVSWRHRRVGLQSASEARRNCPRRQFTGPVSSSFSLGTTYSANFQVIVGGGEGGAFIGGGSVAVGGVAATPEAPPIKEKKEEKEESDDDMKIDIGTRKRSN